MIDGQRDIALLQQIFSADVLTPIEARVLGMLILRRTVERLCGELGIAPATDPDRASDLASASAPGPGG